MQQLPLDCESETGDLRTSCDIQKHIQPAKDDDVIIIESDPLDASEAARNDIFALDPNITANMNLIDSVCCEESCPWNDDSCLDEESIEVQMVLDKMYQSSRVHSTRACLDLMTVEPEVINILGSSAIEMEPLTQTAPGNGKHLICC